MTVRQPTKNEVASTTSRVTNHLRFKSTAERVADIGERERSARRGKVKPVDDPSPWIGQSHVSKLVSGALS
jgi:hypothetical protein